MRNPERIDRITNLMNRLWHNVPDYRFYQFISLIFDFVPESKENTDPFFWEEDVWEEMIRGAMRAYGCEEEESK